MLLEYPVQADKLESKHLSVSTGKWLCNTVYDTGVIGTEAACVFTCVCVGRSTCTHTRVYPHTRVHVCVHNTGLQLSE